MVYPSQTPEYRGQRYEAQRDAINEARRAAYAANAVARERARVQARMWRTNNIERARQHDKNRRLTGLAVYAKQQIGCCQICGYSKYLGALQWAHFDAATKEFEPTLTNRWSWEDAFDELSKCVVLCANCHWETGEHGPEKIPEEKLQQAIRQLRKVTQNGIAEAKAPSRTYRRRVSRPGASLQVRRLKTRTTSS